jgi:hypothetical protein
MGCTIDHLSRDDRFKVIAEFRDLRGIVHKVGDAGVIRDMQVDWARNEICIEWEVDGRPESLFFDLNGKTGPGNGRMRAFFEPDLSPPAVWVRSPLVSEGPPDRAPDNKVVKSTASARPSHSTPAPVDRTLSPPSPETCLGERPSTCDCPGGLNRAIFPEPMGEVRVNACLRCGTVTATICRGDDGRYTGNSYTAYFVAPVSIEMLKWLSQWARGSIDYGSGPQRWPMSANLVRYPVVLIPADARCDTADELIALESRLRSEQKEKSLGSRVRALNHRLPAPPQEVPVSMHGYVQLWEALQLRPESDLKKLISLAQMGGAGSPIATDLLLRRHDAFEVMVAALQSDDGVCRSAGYSMARDARPADPRLEDVLLDMLAKVSTEPLPDVPNRIRGCARVETILVVLLDVGIRTQKSIDALRALQRMLAPLDATTVEYIGVALHEMGSSGITGTPRREGMWLP